MISAQRSKGQYYETKEMMFTIERERRKDLSIFVRGNPSLRVLLVRDHVSELAEKSLVAQQNPGYAASHRLAVEFFTFMKKNG